MALEDGLSAADAGALIKRRRKERGLTQEQLVDRTGLSSQSYLSALEKGRYHIGRSEHFRAVARELHLSEDDIRAINPAAVITLAAPAPAANAPFDPRTLFHPPAQRERVKRDLSPHLSQMIAEKQEKHTDLRETRWQQYLNNTRFATGHEPDAEGWFEMYQALRRNKVEPEPWPDDD